MGILKRIIDLANTEINLFNRKSVKVLENNSTPKPQEVESFFKQVFKNDPEQAAYAFDTYKQTQIDKQVKETNKVLNETARRGKSSIINSSSFFNDVTETIDYGIYGYSTRDEVRQNQGDAEIERWLKDPKVKASFQILTAQVFASPIQVIQQGDSDQSAELKRYIDTALKEQKGTLRCTLKEGLIVALSFQNAFFEKVSGWSENPEFTNKRIVKSYMSKRPGLLEFIADSYDNILSIHSLVNLNEYYDPDRFLIMSFDNMFSNPYGVTLFASTRKYWKAKTLIYQDMVVYSNKFSQPIPLVTYSDETLMVKAQEVSDNLYAGANIALPEGVKAAFITALEKGHNPFIPILEYLDKQISLGICGVDLSQGSFAADKVIADERALNVADIREDIQDFAFEQIIKPLCKDNYDNSIYTIDCYPKIEFLDNKKALSGKELIDSLDTLINNGIISNTRLSDVNKIRVEAGFNELSDDELLEIESELNEPETIEDDNTDIDDIDKVELFNYSFE